MEVTSLSIVDDKHKVWVVIIQMYSGSETDESHIHEVKVFETEQAKDKFIKEFQDLKHWGVKGIHDEEYVIE